jgi:hypothetical protein
MKKKFVKPFENKFVKMNQFYDFVVYFAIMVPSEEGF